MNFASVKQELDHCAVHARNTTLDEIIIDGALLDCLHDGSYQLEKVDIPLGSLVGINKEHRSFFSLGFNWREAMLGVPVNKWDPSNPCTTKGLQCTGWKRDNVQSYFESDLYQKTFHVPNSTNWLRCSFIGGAAYVELGAHRAVAAKIWLAYHQGETAVIKGVYCYRRTLRDCVKSWLHASQKVRGHIKWYTVDSSQYVVKFNDGCTDKLYFYNAPDNLVIDLCKFDIIKKGEREWVAIHSALMTLPQVFSPELIDALLK
ncbi:hypothetical protein [Vibrio jasicida]|uniref:hypothetical protein n=1 Tax=Vibrio jasicida TaxID=766224 RepID=UPI0040689254